MEQNYRYELLDAYDDYDDDDRSTDVVMRILLFVRRC
jgi:hypothetical protein